jgi:hypothetical protein
MHHQEHAMNPLKSAFLCATLAATLPGPAHAAGVVEVQFTSPERYADAGRTERDRDSTLQTLRAHFGQLAAHLPDGQVLQIEVQDIDLAGELLPNSRGRDLRVLNGGADWPRMTLRYTLVAEGKAVKSGTQRLADMDYQSGIKPIDPRELAYERRMIDTWFEREFAAIRSPA